MLAGEPTDGGAVVSDLLDLLLLRFLFLLFCWTEEASATGVEAATGGGVTPRRGLTTGAANFFAGSFPFLIFFFVTWTADVEAPDTEGSEGGGAVEVEGIWDASTIRQARHRT